MKRNKSSKTAFDLMRHYELKKYLEGKSGLILGVTTFLHIPAAGIHTAQFHVGFYWLGLLTSSSRSLRFMAQAQNAGNKSKGKKNRIHILRYETRKRY